MEGAGGIRGIARVIGFDTGFDGLTGHLLPAKVLPGLLSFVLIYGPLVGR
jgi:hypothetical protein